MFEYTLRRLVDKASVDAFTFFIKNPMDMSLEYWLHQTDTESDLYLRKSLINTLEELVQSGDNFDTSLENCEKALKETIDLSHSDIRLYNAQIKDYEHSRNRQCFLLEAEDMDVSSKDIRSSELRKLNRSASAKVFEYKIDQTEAYRKTVEKELGSAKQALAFLNTMKLLFKCREDIIDYFIDCGLDVRDKKIYCTK